MKHKFLQRFRDERAFNIVEILVLVEVLFIIIFLLLPLVNGEDNDMKANQAAQTKLESALGAVTSGIKGSGTFTGVNAQFMSKNPGEFKWLDDQTVTPTTSPTSIPTAIGKANLPTGPDTILIGGSTAGNTVILCNKSTTSEYFCIEQQGKDKKYGQGYSFYFAKLAQNSSWQ